MWSRAERQKLYRSKRWAKLRLRILDRDGWRCRECGKPGRLEVDHVVSMSRGGDACDESNLQALCRGCHHDKTAGENSRPRDLEALAWDRLVNSLEAES